MTPLLIMGPTASGKTALALALAERLPVEIISVDSAQVYRGMDIGTAKPDRATRERVAHHLIDILDPSEPYSAARFAADASRLIGEIQARGRRPLLVGGTMLYFRALRHGLSALPSADARLRARLLDEAVRDGWPALHERLARIDPQTAARLHPNDQQRIQRALEIAELSGEPPSAFFARSRNAGLGPHRAVALVSPDRAEIHRRIEQRFQEMIAGGLVEEVRHLYTRSDLAADLPAMRAVGYRQLLEHVSGRRSLAESVQRGIEATRQFAKRQLTWLRRENEVIWLDPADAELVDKTLNLLE